MPQMLSAAIRPGTGQCDVRGHAADQVRCLDGVPHRVDGGVGSAHVGIGCDGVLDTQLKSCFGGKRAFGGHADGQDDHVCGQGLASRDGYADLTVRILESGHVRAQLKRYAVRAKLIVQQRGHVRVERGHDMGGTLNHGDGHALVGQVLGHFKADEPSAHHHGTFGLFALHEIGDGEGVFHGAQREQAR